MTRIMTQHQQVTCEVIKRFGPFVLVTFMAREHPADGGRVMNRCRWFPVWRLIND